MRQFDRTWGRAIFLLIAWSAATVAGASEPATEPSPPLEFCVWTGECSRSLHCAQRFATAREAAEFARQAREKKTKFVTIFQGEANSSQAFGVLVSARSLSEHEPQISCSVYARRGCRVGWSISEGGRDLKPIAAAALADEIRKSDTPAEVVYRLPRSANDRDATTTKRTTGG